MAEIPDFANEQTRVILKAIDELAVPAGPTLYWRIGPVTRKATTQATSSPPAPLTEGTVPMADLVLTADDQARLAASGVDADGNPVDLTGQLTYGVDNTAVLTLTDNGDGTALIVTTGPTGSALVTATGNGVIGSLAVDVVAGGIASITIAATVEPQGTP